MQDQYVILGVPPFASPEEIEAAYQSRVEALSVQEQAADPSDAAEAAAALARVHHAYAVLSDPVQREAHDRGVGAGAMASSARLPANVCEMCGSTPATVVTLHRETGMIYVRRRHTVAAAMCRSCGLATFRRLTNLTLMTGWWGLISFFANIVTIVQNLGAGRTLAALDPPRPSDVSSRYAFPLPAPMEPGRSLLARPGAYVALTIVGVVAFSVVTVLTAGADRDETGVITGAGEVDSDDLRVGDCFNAPGPVDEESVEISDVGAVPCSQPHDHEVFHVGVLPGGPYPGDDGVAEQVAQACLGEFEAYVGLSYEESVYDFVFIYPSEQAWKQRDLGFSCALVDPNGRVTGSLEGAGR